MADEEEERALEEQLQFQLKEQKDSLADVNDAISGDPSNAELLAVHADLVQAIKDAEDGLFHLKRARLLREADAVLQGTLSSNDVTAEPLDPAEVEAEPLEDPSYSVGSKCRFRHTDGRWYNGVVIGLEGSESAKISFLNPTSESMLMCKFFLQQRCRFGSYCRLSHGVDVPISSLKKYIPTTWETSLIGSTVLAISDTKAGIWREAELESWDERLGTAEVVFRDDGNSAKLGTDAITLSEYAQTSDIEATDTTSDQSDSSDYEDDESSNGLGFLQTTALQSGVQTETAIFAKWENHTRGIASKMMANMGFREGMGLGASGQGMVNPIPVKVLPPKQSLDHAIKAIKKEGIGNETPLSSSKRRTRGGKRKRDKKLAAEAKAAEEEEESRDVFSLINNQLAMHGQILRGGGGGGPAKKAANGDGKKEDRRALLAYEDEIKNLRLQVGRLEEMANRNKKEKAVHDAAMRKLNETRKALADAEDALASTSNAVVRNEKEKKWLKF
ncbi:zinc finger CCCH domain-containing protein 18 [Andrographis paniculata]|uniref:zinc finger CCCH domain-containing protein 18 n=1 Tax=Andrographis paniculata TaxID=175694 RepID=UPI0021E8C0D4|nr:zinc finger CCCH domain-containing protein 18 [Andrographis paniculata]XP_051130073.1 zinc finger CCCH domain-containing protein 18 [Andrographis paniculata]